MNPKQSDLLIVGLGNPGLRYRSTRHNVGFLAVESFARKNRCAFRHNRFLKSLVAQGEVGGRRVWLALPQTFMNCSGEALRALAKARRLDPDHILIVCDDVALPLGVLRIKPKGSDGGHKGLASVVEQLKTKDIARLRIGIGRKTLAGDLADYVLSPFCRQERAVLKDVFKKTTAAMETWIAEGVHACMNHFNKKTKGEETPKT